MKKDSKTSMEPPEDSAPPQSCAQKTRRSCLVCINVLVLLVGLCFIGIGIAAQTQYSSALTFNTTLVSAQSAENFKRITEIAPIAFIAFGSFITFFCATGIIGGCCSYRPMLFIYIFFLAVLVICQLGIGGYAIAERNSVSESANDIVSTGWDNSASQALFQTACGQTLLATRANNATCNKQKGATIKTCQNCISGILTDNLAAFGAFLLVLVIFEIFALVLAAYELRKKAPASLKQEKKDFEEKLRQLETVRVV